MFFLLRRLLCLIHGVSYEEWMKAERATIKRTRYRRPRRTNRYRRWVIKKNILCESCGVEHQSKSNRKDLSNVFYLCDGIFYYRVSTFCNKCLEDLLKISDNKRKPIEQYDGLSVDEYINGICDSCKKVLKKPVKTNDEDIPF